MTEKRFKYGTSFTSGSLLFKEAELVIPSINNEVAFMSGEEELNMDILPINSESSKKRIKHELKNRLRSLGNADFIALYKTSDDTNKKLILFYAACKLYPLIADFMLEVILNKWYNLDFEISTADFQNFLYRKMDTHPELYEISEYTRYKLSQVALKMLKDLGLTKNNILQKLDFNPHILKNVHLTGIVGF